MYKKRILVDLDGVLNDYRGKYTDEIPDMKIGADIFLKTLSEEYEVVIFSTRDKVNIEKWLKKYNLEVFVTEVTNIKKPAYLLIDDRCLTFGGNYADILDKIKNFRVWYS